jgi:hypothetical protein
MRNNEYLVLAAHKFHTCRLIYECLYIGGYYGLGHDEVPHMGGSAMCLTHVLSFAEDCPLYLGGTFGILETLRLYPCSLYWTVVVRHVIIIFISFRSVLMFIGLLADPKLLLLLLF